ncbi:hypothetical protein MMA231_04289 (plasmid) [Asticcacaulis sp. MM231]
MRKSLTALAVVLLLSASQAVFMQGRKISQLFSIKLIGFL